MSSFEKRTLGLALRSTLFSRSELLEFAGLVDESGPFRTIFFPDITASYDSIELSTATLATTRYIHAGSGVLRPLEHDVATITRRIGTLQFLSDNRFVLGVGTGRPTATPAVTIRELLGKVKEVRERFGADFKGRLKMPPIYMAALRPSIARMTVGHVDGLILNFCSASYAHGLVESVRSNAASSKIAPKTFACYIKIFYSADEAIARRLLVSELKHYDENPQYHRTFEMQGVAEEIARAVEGLAGKGIPEIPPSLARISLANPSVRDLSRLVNGFREAGVTLPCLYPYFAPTDDSAFKLGVMEELMNVG